MEGVGVQASTGTHKGEEEGEVEGSEKGSRDKAARMMEGEVAEGREVTALER